MNWEDEAVSFLTVDATDMKDIRTAMQEGSCLNLKGDSSSVPLGIFNYLSGQPLSRTRATIRSVFFLNIVLTKLSGKSAVKIYNLQYLPDRLPDPLAQIYSSLN